MDLSACETEEATVKAQSTPSPDPFAAKMVHFASPPPAFGAVKALFQAGNGWDLDEDENPRFVHAVNGTKLRGAFSYHIVLPESSVGETAPLAHKELAFEILKSMGVDTVWLHIALLAYAIEIGNNKAFVIPGERLHALFGLNRRKDLTAAEKDCYCLRQVEILQRLGIAILRLEVNGQQVQYRQSIGTMWDLAFEEHGQRFLTPQVFQDRERRWVRKYNCWQLIGRPGVAWAGLFLYNEDPQLKPIRQFGAMARDMLEKIDRHRAPLAAALAIMLTFFSRFGGKARIPITNRQILEFSGENLNPSNRDQKRKIKNRLLNAIEEQRRWGWTPNYEEWPPELRPDLAVARADRITDGSEATPTNLPRGYWEQLLRCTTSFQPPPEILEENSRLTKQLKHKAPIPASLLVTSYAADFKQCLERLQMLGFSQSQVASTLKVSQSMISRWYSGERKVAKHHLQSVQALLAQQLRKAPGPRHDR